MVRLSCREGLTARQLGTAKRVRNGDNFGPPERRQGKRQRVIDNFALGLVHVLLVLAFWRMLRRDDLDRDPDRG